MRSIEHAIPAYLPPPAGPVTHYVEFEYPPQRGVDWKPATERIPCYGLCEAELFKRTNERLRMCNVRIVPRVLAPLEVVCGILVVDEGVSAK